MGSGVGVNEGSQGLDRESSGTAVGVPVSLTQPMGECNIQDFSHALVHVESAHNYFCAFTITVESSPDLQVKDRI